MTLVLTYLLMGPALAHAAIRCGTSLVDLGDWPVEVRDRCGEPDYVAVYPTRAVPGLGVTQTVEHWYYNPGPHRLIRRLEFRNGSLQRVKEPLINSESPLRDLRAVAARRGPQPMAVALGKGRNAADAALRARPSGPSERSTLGVATF